MLLTCTQILSECIIQARSHPTSINQTSYTNPGSDQPIQTSLSTNSTLDIKSTSSVSEVLDTSVHIGALQSTCHETDLENTLIGELGNNGPAVNNVKKISSGVLVNPIDDIIKPCGSKPINPKVLLDNGHQVRKSSLIHSGHDRSSASLSLNEPNFKSKSELMTVVDACELRTVPNISCEDLYRAIKKCPQWLGMII